MLLYPTLLVQQGRGERGQDTRCSDFRFDNTHLEIGAADDVAAEFPGARMLDFKHPEVREERFALIEETLTRYPVDGFELQLNYGLHYFHPREIDAGRAIMSDWVERVYRAVKASGENRELVIRLPASLEGCHGIGLRRAMPTVNSSIRMRSLNHLWGQRPTRKLAYTQRFRVGLIRIAWEMRRRR